MTLTVYADFNEPMTYVVSQRLDAVAATTRQDVRWCAVERQPGMPVLGVRLGEQEEHQALQELMGHARPEEHLPEHVPAMVNSRAATSAYAEAVSDGLHHELRRALLAALWRDGADLSSPDEVRRVVVSVSLPQTADVRTARTSNWAPLGVPDPMTVVRQLGGTTTRLGGPVTTAAHRRIVAGRAQWEQRGAPAQPLLITPLGEALVGVHALAYLAAKLPRPAQAPAAVGPAAVPADDHRMAPV